MKKEGNINFLIYFGLNNLEFVFVRGTEDYYKMMGSVDIVNSTLGKALGGASGGYTTGPKELIDILRQRSRPYLFSNSLPPVIVGIAIKVRKFKRNILINGSLRTILFI